MSCTLTGNGSTGPVTAASDDLRTCPLVESGRFFQRRWQSAALPAGIPFDPARTRLATAARPDPIFFVLRFTPTALVKEATIAMTLDLPNGEYQNVESLINEPRTREFRFQVGAPTAE